MVGLGGVAFEVEQLPFERSVVVGVDMAFVAQFLVRGPLLDVD